MSMMIATMAFAWHIAAALAVMFAIGNYCSRITFISGVFCHEGSKKEKAGLENLDYKEVGIKLITL